MTEPQGDELQNDDDDGEAGEPASAEAVPATDAEPPAPEPTPAAAAPEVAPAPSPAPTLFPALPAPAGMFPLIEGSRLPGLPSPLDRPVPPIFRPPPPPKPPVIPQRTADGWSTPNLALRRADGRGNAYFDVVTRTGGRQTVYVSAAQMRRLTTLATTPQLDSGILWRTFSRIPLERPLPSRSLDEELRLLLAALANDSHLFRP